MLKVNNHSPCKFPLLHFFKNSIYVFEWTHGYFWYNFPFGTETEGLFQVFTSTYQRADNLNAIQHQAWNTQVHRFYWKPHRHNTPRGADTGNCRVKC